MKITIDTNKTTNSIKAFAIKHRRAIKYAGIAVGVAAVAGAAYVICRKTGAHHILIDATVTSVDTVSDVAASTTE